MGEENAPIENIGEFNKTFMNSKFIVAVTGAGISAESGIPTFRGKGGYWRGYTVQSLAAMSKFKENPSLVWEFYHYRREIVLTKNPNSQTMEHIIEYNTVRIEGSVLINPKYVFYAYEDTTNLFSRKQGHICLAKMEKQLAEQNKKLVVITQNIDELHSKAGSKNVVELHGTLFKTECLMCGNVCENFDSPICPALLGKGSPDEGTEDAAIPAELLPRCHIEDCKGLLRPYIIWFDEDPTPENMDQSYEWLNECDLCLVIGTSSIVDPANEFGPYVTARGIPVAEFNMEKTPATNKFQFHISGPCGTTLMEALQL